MTPAPWLEPLLDARTMRATDAWAIEQRGIPSLELMERAGQALARVTASVVPDGRIAIVCGKGNNGGDGLVAARLLRQGARQVDVILASPPAQLSADAAEQLKRLDGPVPRMLDEGPSGHVAGVVDALLGTGFEGAARGAAAAGIELVDSLGVPTVAADVPSGVDASTGEVAGPAVRAVATVAFHAAKPGLWISPGKTHAGEVHVVDIGIPAGAPHDQRSGLIRAEVLHALPRRDATSTKFSSGNVFVVGGSTGLTGAPTMAAMAAQRAGAGYVTVAAPRSLELAFASRLLEAMFVGLDEDDGALTPESAQTLAERLTRANAVVLGPGLGRGAAARAMARELATTVQAPLVVDADGLNALGESYGEVLAGRDAPTVLTPHAGELARMLGLPSDVINSRRLRHARATAERSGAIVVLKGDDTLVAMPDGAVAVSPGGAPGLATAGTGDVLAGVIGALLARGVEAPRAVCAGVLAHVRAGRLAAADHGAESVIASDVIAGLPAAMAA